MRANMMPPNAMGSHYVHDLLDVNAPLSKLDALKSILAKFNLTLEELLAELEELSTDETISVLNTLINQFYGFHPYKKATYPYVDISIYDSYLKEYEKSKFPMINYTEPSINHMYTYNPKITFNQLDKYSLTPSSSYISYYHDKPEAGIDSDMKKIKGFLEDKTAVELELTALDQALTEYLTARGVLAVGTLQLNTSYLNRTDRERSHRYLLSNFFTQWAAVAGFDAVLKRMKGPLKDKQFYSVLMQGSLFKDTYFTRSSHGTWTHLIQWWCIVSHHNRQLNKGGTFLKNKPAHIYRLIGAMDNYYKTSYWFDHFEIPPLMKTLDASYGHFETMAIFLLSAECRERMPVLAQMIRRYEHKQEYIWSGLEGDDQEILRLK